jgi:hypothetical protein
LFGHQGEGGEQFHEDLDDHLGHSGCRGDLGIDIESIEKVVNQLEQVNQRIVAVNNALDRLIYLGVRNTM